MEKIGRSTQLSRAGLNDYPLSARRDPLFAGLEFVIGCNGLLQRKLSGFGVNPSVARHRGSPPSIRRESPNKECSGLSQGRAALVGLGAPRFPDGITTKSPRLVLLYAVCRWRCPNYLPVPRVGEKIE